MGCTALLADDDVQRMVQSMNTEARASLALSRATLRVVASLSPSLYAIADAALEAEAELAGRHDLNAALSVFETVDEARRELRAALAEAHLVQALERALIAAADALPDAVCSEEPESLLLFG